MQAGLHSLCDQQLSFYKIAVQLVLNDILSQRQVTASRLFSVSY